jgi:hypothetical protein
MRGGSDILENPTPQRPPNPHSSRRSVGHCKNGRTGGHEAGLIAQSREAAERGLVEYNAAVAVDHA